MNLSLVVVAGSGEGKEIPIRLPQFLIGRDPACQLRPASQHISLRHCAILNMPDKVVLKDLGSTNGSFVNDARVEGEMELAHGDFIKFGPLVFRVKMEASAVRSQALTATPVPSQSMVATPIATPRVVTSGTQTAKRTAAQEDDIAAMLFNFADAPSDTIAAENIPTGSTVTGLTIDPTTIEQPAVPDDKKSSEKKNTAKAKFQDHATSSQAAQAILDKYMRRPR